MAHRMKCLDCGFAQRHFNGVPAWAGTESKDTLRPAIGIGRHVFQLEASTEPAVARSDGKGDLCTRQRIAVLISHFHDDGSCQYRTCRALLVVAGNYIQRLRTRERRFRRNCGKDKIRLAHVPRGIDGPDLDIMPGSRGKTRKSPSITALGMTPL